MLSAFQSIMLAQLNVNQIISPSENFLKDALTYARAGVPSFWYAGVRLRWRRG